MIDMSHFLDVVFPSTFSRMRYDFVITITKAFNRTCKREKKHIRNRLGKRTINQSSTFLNMIGREDWHLANSFVCCRMTVPTYVTYLCCLPTLPTYVAYRWSLPTLPTYIAYVCFLPMLLTYITYLHYLPMWWYLQMKIVKSYYVSSWFFKCLSVP